MTVDLRGRIASLLRQANALTTGEVAHITGVTQTDAQATLHAMDDAGDVILRNGFYRASERLKAEVRA